MKKISAIIMTAVMTVCLCVNAFAAPNGFISSPSGNAAPEVESFVPDDKDCTAELVITPYVNKDTLSESAKALMVRAYKSITNTDDLTTLNSDLAALVKEKGISPKNLAVSDLFDASCKGCQNHDEHNGFTVTLKADTLNNFVALLQMNSDGEWVLVLNAVVSEDGEHLSFHVDNPTLFAVIVEKGSVISPDTGDRSIVNIGAVMAVACCSTGVFMIVKSFKIKRKDGTV